MRVLALVHTRAIEQIPSMRRAVAKEGWSLSAGEASGAVASPRDVALGGGGAEGVDQLAVEPESVIGSGLEWSERS